MKKFLLYFTFIFSLVLLSGCEMNNTPTKKVEAYLNDYKNLSDTVLTQLDNTIDADTIMTTEQKNTYKGILKNQYQNMTYMIKDEVINGDKATVTAEIEVLDFYKLTAAADKYYKTQPDEFKDTNGNMVETKYIDYKLTKMKSYTDKVKYTIDFTLTKTNRTWVLDDVSETTRQKIHGLYAY